MLPTDALHMSLFMSGENSVAPPVAPTRASLTRFFVSVDLNDPCSV